MDSGADEDYHGRPFGEEGAITAPLVPKITDDVSLDIPPLQTSQKHLGSIGKLLDFFRRDVNQGEAASLSAPPPAGIGRHRLHMGFTRKIDWVSLRKACMEWIKNPMNLAFLLWLICVSCFLSLLFLLLTELVDDAFPTTSSRNHWIEICNQVLNALFTLMSLYQHPKLLHHLVLLCRWRSEDTVELREAYCKNGVRRPHERAHMTVVLLLLQVACFAQYGLCGLYWGYRNRERPELAEDFFVAVGVLAPVSAGLYAVYSPLGGEYDSDASDEESHGLVSSTPRAQRNLDLKLHKQRAAVGRPEWAGDLFDVGDDVPVGLLSFFCTCCVFGWNMGRLGFGNAYVHAATFVLLFVAPYWIFAISALNIHDGVIRRAVRMTGLVLSLLCLLYGGFWRIQMRRRFGLPASTSCRGTASLGDYARWLFCWGCALAQEVRTGNFYDVEGDSLCMKFGDGGEEDGEPVARPLSPTPSSCDDDGEIPAMGSESSDPGLRLPASHLGSFEIPAMGSDPGPRPPASHLGSSPSLPGDVVLGECSGHGGQVLVVGEGLSPRSGGDAAMVPPATPLMQLEDKDCNEQLRASED